MKRDVGLFASGLIVPVRYKKNTEGMDEKVNVF